MRRILAGGPTADPNSAHARAWRQCIEAQVVDGWEIVFHAIHVPAVDDYEVTEAGHTWGSAAIARVARAREEMLTAARRERYDALWMVDDDVLCAPDTLSRMIKHLHDAPDDVGVVVGVYWTAGWDPNDPARELPQVWGRHPYGLEQETIQRLSNGEAVTVAGGEGCTLVSPDAMFTDHYWPPLTGLEHWWEDRWACIRWGSAGVLIDALGGLDIVHCYTAPQRTPESVAAVVGRLLGRADGVEPEPVAQPATGQLAGRELVLALPWYGSVDVRTSLSITALVGLWASHGGSFRVEVIQRSEVKIARDELTHRLAGKVSDDAYVLWVDGDMTFDAVEAVAFIAQCWPGSVIGAAGRQKQERIVYCAGVYTEVGQDWPRPNGAEHLLPAFVGGAFVVMRGVTLKRLHAEAPAYRRESNVVRDVWQARTFTSGDEQVWQGEDAGMMRHAAACGVTTWVDPTMRLGHVGTHVFSGRMADGDGPDLAGQTVGQGEGSDHNRGTNDAS